MVQDEAKIYFRKTLYFRIILVLLFLAVVFITALYVLYVASCSRFEEELESHSNQLTKQICRNVEVTLKELSEKILPITTSNEHLGPLLQAVPPMGMGEYPQYTQLRINKELSDILGLHYSARWICAVDRRDQVYCVQKDVGSKRAVPDHSELKQLYLDSRQELASRYGNTVWVRGFDENSMILMRSVLDFDTMEFCGCIMAEIDNAPIREIMEGMDENAEDWFILYDRKGRILYSSHESVNSGLEKWPENNDHLSKQGELLQSEYLIDKGRMKILHVVNLSERNKRFSDLIALIVEIGVAVFLAMVLLFWMMFGNMVRNLKTLLKNIYRISGGDFQLEPVYFMKGSELDLIAVNISRQAGKIQDLMKQVVHDREMQKLNQYRLLELRYHELQSQVNPHFLFNILQSINGIAQINGDMQVSRIICRLSKFFRGNVDRRYTSCELREELEYARNYLELYHSLYPDRVEIIWDIDEKFLNASVPTYILLPIVENSMVHGMEPMIRTCTVKISVHEEKGNLELIVWDNGEGIPPELLKEIFDRNTKKKRIGIKNVQDRIQILYGKEYGLSVESEYHCYTRVRMILPLPAENS